MRSSAAGIATGASAAGFGLALLVWWASATPANTQPVRQSGPALSASSAAGGLLGGDPLCGHRALYHACLRLGVPAQPEALLARLPAAAEGVDMLTLKAAAQEMGVAVRAARPGWDELVRLDTVSDPRRGA